MTGYGISRTIGASTVTTAVAVTEVDHFIPRARSANDSMEKFRLTDRACNGDKSDLLAAPGFVADWTHRNREQAAGLAHRRDGRSGERPSRHSGGGEVDLRTPPARGRSDVAWAETSRCC